MRSLPTSMLSGPRRRKVAFFLSAAAYARVEHRDRFSETQGTRHAVQRAMPQLAQDLEATANLGKYCSARGELR